MKKVKNPAGTQMLWLYPSDKKKLKELAKEVSRSEIVRRWIRNADAIQLLADWADFEGTTMLKAIKGLLESKKTGGDLRKI